MGAAGGAGVWSGAAGAVCTSSPVGCSSAAAPSQEQLLHPPPAAGRTCLCWCPAPCRSRTPSSDIHGLRSGGGKHSCSNCHPASGQQRGLGHSSFEHNQPTKQGCWHTCRPGCTLPHCRAAQGSAPLPRPPCCMRRHGGVSSGQQRRLAAAAAARAAGCASSVRPEAGWAAVIFPMLALHTYSETRGGGARCWAREQSPHPTWCLAVPTAVLGALFEPCRGQAAARSRRNEAGGEGRRPLELLQPHLRASCLPSGCGAPNEPAPGAPHTRVLRAQQAARNAPFPRLPISHLAINPTCRCCRQPPRRPGEPCRRVQGVQPRTRAWWSCVATS